MCRAMRNQMIRPWVKGYKKHPILHAEFIYMDVDTTGRGTRLMRSSCPATVRSAVASTACALSIATLLR